MSQKWPGGIIRKTPVTPTGPYQNSAAPGVWTLDQQAYWQKQGQWPTAGSVDPSAFIENLFSTYLYTGNGSTQTITNGIDLSGKGGLVWGKSRSNAYDNFLADSVRGSNKLLYSNQTYAQQTDANVFTAFNSNGFSLGVGGAVPSNTNGATYASWTFREQAKFFDVVTYTGNGANRTISHNLGSVPGTIIIKRTDTTSAWAVYHRSLANTEYMVLNTTAAKATGATYWNSTTPTSTVFSLGTATDVNASGGTFVAYLFAHNAGGFGLTGTDNVISCGSFTTDGSGNATVNLGYEPQWVLYKPSATTSNWYLMDIMRGMSITSGAYLFPNASSAEGAANYIVPNATGFTIGNWNVSETSIYIAIRRGPMKVPTDATKVYNTVGGSGANPAYIAGFPVDLALRRYTAGTQGNKFYSRLTGTTYLDSTSTAAEVTDSNGKFDYQNAWFSNPDGSGYYSWMWKRAPSFFDEVCYTGTGSNTTQAHNLNAVPELMIVKVRNQAGYDWHVYSATVGATKFLVLNTTAGPVTDLGDWNNTDPTSSVFTVGANSEVNGSGNTYVAYLFATCAGVSKVGSYTGTAALQTVNCGFAAGARFVLIKRTDSTGDWYVWDSARGISSGNDPYLLLNSTAAEVTGTNYVDTTAVGFQVTAAAPAALNASGGTYIFLAIA